MKMYVTYVQHLKQPCNMVVTFGKVSAFLCTIFFVWIDIFTNAHGSFEVVSLWKTGAQNDSDRCALRDNDGEYLFTGGQGGQTCGIQVIVDEEPGIQMTVLDSTSKNTFVYVEKQGNLASCESKYVVMTGHEHGESCSTVFVNPNVQVFLKGNASILIRPVTGNQSLTLCQDGPDSEVQLISESSKDEGCSLVKYNQSITCTPSSHDTYWALTLMEFPSECTNTIGNRFIESRCPNDSVHQSQKYLIIYPDDVTFLNLNKLNLDAIGERAFIGLNHLDRLYVSYNRLTQVNGKTFVSLTSLTHLRLRFNNIGNLAPHVFDELTKLDFLVLWSNELKQLPTDLFRYTKELNVLNLQYNQLTSLQPNLFSETNKLTRLFLAYNNLTSIDANMLKQTTQLQILFLWHNVLDALSYGLIGNLTQLTALSLGNNEITDLRSDLFWQLGKLTFLRLGYNYLESIHHRLFEAQNKLEILFLDFNLITAFYHDTFSTTVSLLLLDLSGNQLTHIPNIQHLYHIELLGLREIPFTFVDKNAFNDVPHQFEVFVSPTEICECYVPSNASCTALDARSPYLTCDRLLSNRVLMVMMWVIGLNAFGGNLFILGRNRRQTERKVAGNFQSFLLANLAMSDLLMGIYMLIIASADIYFGESFPLQAEIWRSGMTCRVAGAMSILSSEASVFFVTLISLDRFRNIRSPHLRRSMGTKLSVIAVTLTWIISLALAVVPSILAGDYKFYDVSHVCIGLPLAKLELFSKDVSEEFIQLSTYRYAKYVVKSRSLGQVPGLYYASANFLGLNGMCYFVILLCYVDIVRSVYKSTKSVGLKKGDRSHFKMNAKVTAIVLTDFLCWAPVVILGILVQVGLLTLPPSVFAWIVTVVLPINSAINPYLYTIVDLVINRRKQIKQEGAKQTTESTQSVSIKTDYSSHRKPVSGNHISDETQM